MKKFLHNPLFYKDFKSARWISLIMLLYLIKFKLLIFSPILNVIKSTITDFTDISPGNMTPFKADMAYWFRNNLLYSAQDIIVITIFVVILLIVLFKNERNNSTYSFTASMPFKREEIVKIKWITGMLSISIPFFITFILVSIFYFKNTNWINDPYIIVFQWFIINILTFTAIFSFIFFIQTIMGQNITASIIGALVLGIPGGCIVMSIDFILSHYKNPIYPKDIPYILEKVMIYFMSFPDYSVQKLGEYTTRVSYYKNFQIKILILIVTCIVTYALSIYFFKRNSLEKTGFLIMFKPFEYILKFIVAIFLGLLMALIFGQSYAEDTLVVMYVSLILGFLASYFVTDKCIKYYSR